VDDVRHTFVRVDNLQSLVIVLTTQPDELSFDPVGRIIEGRTRKRGSGRFPSSSGDGVFALDEPLAPERAAGPWVTKRSVNGDGQILARCVASVLASASNPSRLTSTLRPLLACT
jgi:hypothetical protein